MMAANLKKRKQDADSKDSLPKKSCSADSESKPTLITPHQPIITTLTPKHTLLPLSIISSTKIQSRVTSATRHLLDHPEEGIVLLYARPAEVCKLITVAEQSKRLLRGEGKACWQYNEMFDMEREERKKQGKGKIEVVEKTVLESADEDEDEEDEEDDFEVMESRFEKAVLPPSKPTTVKSMRVFLSLDAVQELKTREGVTLQMSEVKPA